MDENREGANAGVRPLHLIAEVLGMFNELYTTQI